MAAAAASGDCVGVLTRFSLFFSTNSSDKDSQQLRFLSQKKKSNYGFVTGLLGLSY
jgi:hypothetical protein